MFKKANLFILLASMYGPLFGQGPAERFEQLWTDFNLHYSYFEAKGVNWDAVKARYAPMFAKKLSKKREAQLLGQVIYELRDAHVSLQTQFGVYRYVKNKPAPTGEDFSKYFSTSIFENNTTHILTSEDSVVLLRVMNLDNEIIPFDTLWEVLRHAKGLIVDLSDNNGGNERYARDFLERIICD